MKNIKSYNEFLNEDVSASIEKEDGLTRQGRGEYYGRSPVKDEKFSVTVVTEEAIERYKTEHPSEPISAKNVGYHFSPKPRKEALAHKAQIEAEGVFNGEKVQSVTLSPASEKVGENE